MQVQRKQGEVMYRHGVWSGATTSSCYGCIYALALHTHTPYMFVCVL